MKADTFHSLLTAVSSVPRTVFIASKYMLNKCLLSERARWFVYFWFISTKHRTGKTAICLQISFLPILQSNWNLGF